MSNIHRKKLYDNGYSYVLLEDDKIQILTNKYDTFSPRSLKVAEGTQIEFGRSIEEFKKCLSDTRIPLVVREVKLPIPEIHGYQLIRMQTGNVDDRVLLNITEKDNEIIKLDFNRELKNDSEFRKYCNLPAINQLTIPSKAIQGTTQLEINFSQYNSIILNALFHGYATFVQANCGNNQIDIMVDSDTVLLNIRFILNTSTDMYELVSVSRM